MAERDLLLSLLWRQAALLSAGVALLALAQPLLRRAGPRLAYAAWGLLPLLLLTPALPRPAREPLALVLPAAGAWAHGARDTLPALPLPQTSAGAAWAALWLTGAAAVLLVQAARQWRLARLGRTLPAGSSPALVGLLRPHIALPTDFEQRFSPVERELILAHEQVHRARLDNLWNLLACVLAALHWWNPLAWWAARRFRADQELACDATVLASRPASRADYTRALLAAHDLRSLGAPLASRWGTHHPLVERIAMLTTNRTPRRRHMLMLGFALFGTVGASYALQTKAVEPPVVEGVLQLRYELRVSVDGKEVSHPRLVSFPASPVSIVFNEPDAPRLWKLALSSVFTDEKHLMIETELSLSDDESAILAWRMAKGKSPMPQVHHVASPRLLVADGSMGRLETTTPDGRHRLALEIQLRSFRQPSPDYSAPKL